MSNTTIALVEKEIITIIKRFKFEELELSVMNAFPEISWNSLKSELVKHRKAFTSMNVAQFIKRAITERNFTVKVLKDRLLTLRLIDVNWHSKRITWYGYALVNVNKFKDYLMNREIQNTMQDSFHSLNININVKVNTHNGITYVALFENKRRKKNQRYVTTMYLALFMGQKYFFCSKKHVPSHILSAIIRCLGYKDSKRLKLMGKDLRSLSKLCWKKMEGAINCDNIDKVIEYKDAAPDIKKTGTDFTQYRQRKKYSEMCFGDDPPALELLVLKAPSIPIVHKGILTELSNESIRAAWEFRSHNIVKCLTKLIEQRVLTTPVPYYISNLLVSGKNEITIRN